MDTDHPSRHGVRPWKSEETRERLLREFSAILDRVVSQLSASAPNFDQLFTIEQVEIKSPVVDGVKPDEEKAREVESQGMQRDPQTQVADANNEEPSNNAENKSDDNKSKEKLKDKDSDKPDNSVPSEHASLIARVATQHKDKEVVGNEVSDQQHVKNEGPKLSAKQAVSNDLSQKNEANTDTRSAHLRSAQNSVEAKVETSEKESISEASKKQQLLSKSTTPALPPTTSELVPVAEPVRLQVLEAELFARALSLKMNHGAAVRTVASHNSPNSSVQDASSAAQVKGDSAERAKKPREAQAPTRQMATKAFERVQDALKEVVKSRDGKTISVRLDPPDLGTVKIDISLKNGNLHARIITEAQHVNALLRDRSHELQQVLRQLAGDVENVSVSIVSGHGHSATDDGTASAGQRRFENGEHKGWAAPGSKAQSAGSAMPQAAARSKVYDHWVA